MNQKPASRRQAAPRAAILNKESIISPFIEPYDFIIPVKVHLKSIDGRGNKRFTGPLPACTMKERKSLKRKEALP
jgi:hypothetical protein